MYFELQLIYQLLLIKKIIPPCIYFDITPWPAIIYQKDNLQYIKLNKGSQ